MYAYRPWSINTVKIWHDGQKPFEPKTHEKCKLFARVCSHKVFKCPPFARTHAWRRFLHWSIAVSMMSSWTSDHTTIKRSSSSLIFAVFLSYAEVELLSVSLQGFNAECINGRISHIWLFCDIFAYFGQKLVAMVMSLDPCNQKCLLWIDRLRKPPVTSNRILAISCRNSFICICSNFSTKIGCHGNAPLFLVYGSVTYEFHDSTNPISKPNSARICCIQLKLWPILWFLA